MYPIDFNTYRSSAFNRRVRFLVMHYTATNFDESVRLLMDSVSAHYLVPDPSDPTYAARFSGLRVFQMVEESDRAWHAGVSSWAGRNNLNDTAIGIEIVNPATNDGDTYAFPPYHPEQIAAVKQLAQSILQRYPDISPTHVLGHSDIAVGRKSDPGAAFPWKALHDAGVGAWFDEATREQWEATFTRGMPTRSDVVAQFARYGYNTSGAETEEGFKQLVRAFQLHFRASKFDGVLDIETASILYALNAKYFPSKPRA
jgi:N-acetylmuramoyl-L-alanine amidase